MYYGSCPTCIINVCGRLNLNTAQNLHFNLLDAEISWHDAKLTLVREQNRWRLVGGFGGMSEEGTEIRFQHSQTFRELGFGTVSFTFPCTKEGLQSIKNVVGSNTVLFCTLD